MKWLVFCNWQSEYLMSKLQVWLERNKSPVFHLDSSEGYCSRFVFTTKLTGSVKFYMTTPSIKVINCRQEREINFVYC